MTPRLPQEILERIFLVLFDDTRALFSATQDESQKTALCREEMQNNCAWSLVSRRWGQAGLAVKWATLIWTYDDNDAGIGHLAQPIAVPYVVSLHMNGCPTSWLQDELHHFAHRLVFLDLQLVDYDEHGLGGLRLCTNVERLGVSCSAQRHGNLHEILDVLRFLPRLEHLSISRFDAPPPLHRRQKPEEPCVYIPSPRLTSLSLQIVGGTKPGALLHKAFNSTKLPRLSSLKPVHIDPPLCLSLATEFQSTVSRLVYDIDIKDDAVDQRLLPNCPFPSLRHLRLRIQPVLPPSQVFATLRKRALTLFKRRQHTLLHLMSLLMTEIAWPATLSNQRTAADSRYASAFSKDEPPFAYTAAGGSAVWRVQLQQIALVQLEEAFEAKVLVCVRDELCGPVQFPFEEILRRGREMRRTFGEEEEAEEETSWTVAFREDGKDEEGSLVDE